VQALATGG